MVKLISLSLIPAVAAAPLKVFLMAGQSNMQGQASIDETDSAGNFKNGTLRYLVSDERTKSDFAGVLASDGSWVVRDDVIISTTDQDGRTGSLTVGFGNDPSRIGVELSFGMRLGDALGERVLLIKSDWGGKSLSGDFRPPSAVAARGNPQGSDLVSLPSGKKSGVYFKEAVDNFRNVLSRIPQIVPNYSSKDGYEIAAFQWHQGWNDACDFDHNLDDTKNAANEYEKNLKDFIKDMRTELSDIDSSDWPFVVGATGQGGSPGREAKNCDSDFGGSVCQSLRMIWSADMAAKDFPGSGTVLSVDSVPFLREKQYSPGEQGYHWWNNAETYFLLGRAMADVTLEALSGSPPAPAPSPTPSGTCEDRCLSDGHCCEGTVSSYQHPSCAMGCIIARHTGSVSECQAKCREGDNTCSWSIAGITLEQCNDCPAGCDASGGVQECLSGCEHGFASWII